MLRIVTGGAAGLEILQVPRSTTRAAANVAGMKAVPCDLPPTVGGKLEFTQALRALIDLNPRFGDEISFRTGFGVAADPREEVKAAIADYLLDMIENVLDVLRGRRENVTMVINHWGNSSFSLWPEPSRCYRHPPGSLLPTITFSLSYPTIRSAVNQANTAVEILCGN